LEMGEDDSVPDIVPVSMDVDTVDLAPTSVNFIVVPGANNGHCRS